MMNRSSGGLNFDDTVSLHLQVRIESAVGKKRIEVLFLAND